MTVNDRSLDKLAAISQSSKEKDYWLNQLSGDWNKSYFIYDTAAGTPPEGKKKLEAMKYQLPGELYQRLMKLRNGVDMTLHMILVGAVAALLHKYNGTTDILVGAPVLKQKTKENFINTILPLRIPVYPGMTFKELLLQTKQVVVDATKNQNCPVDTLFDHLQGSTRAGKDLQSFPLFAVAVLLENIHDKSYIEHTHPDMIFSFLRKESEPLIEGTLEYNPGLYQTDTIKNIIIHFRDLLEQVVIDLEKRMVEIDLLSEAERSQLHCSESAAAGPYPVHRTIYELIEDQVNRTPTGEALVEAGSHAPGMTYKELDESANQVAHYVKGQLDMRERYPALVGVLMENSTYLVQALLGVLKGGAAYVPLDPELPEERLKTILQDADIRLVISLKKHIKTLERLQWECPSFNTFLCMDTWEIHGEEETVKNELMDEKLWDYVAETAVDEITGGGWNTSYTGLPFSQLEMEEYGDNVLRKVEPLLNNQTRVLEIGCASGISMYRIAPRVAFYHGTDLSERIIEKNKQRVAKEGQTNIRLSHIPAHRILEIEEKDFDLVILNSVIQSFHGYNYLRKVIGNAIALLAPQGNLFIGDIMDHDLKGRLIRDLIDFKQANRGKGYQTKTDFSTELFVARGFFQDLAVDNPEILHLEFTPKIRTIENELTKFRYDLLITIDKTGQSHQNPGNHKKLKNHHDKKELEQCPKEKAVSQAAPSDPAYVIYTSGTTGAPKGVMIEHKSLVNYAWWAMKTYIESSNGQRGGTFPLYSSIAFDLTVTSVYLPLLSGHTVVVYGKDDDQYIYPIRRIVKEDRVDLIKATPSHLKILQDEITGENRRLKAFIVGGEELERTLARDIYLASDRKVEIYNEYGPTEATVGCMVYKYDYERDYRRTISIGKPAANTGIYLLDPSFNPVPINAGGEIYIGGAALARGYVNRVELTAAKFLPIFNQSGQSCQASHFIQSHRPSKSNKANRSYISKKLYKTGDLARRLLDGNIEFLGRSDEQVKIRGYRIELQEIESQLRTHSDIKEAVVISWEAQGAESAHFEGEREAGDKLLCAYIVPEGEKEVEVSGVIDYLSVRLPAYMIPVYFVPIDRIPLTTHGKIDKKALPLPSAQGMRSTLGVKYTAPKTKTEKIIAGIWQEVLKIEKVGIHDNFFHIGGNSLRVITAIAHIHRELSVKIPIGEFFNHPTIQQLGEYIAGARVSDCSIINPVEKRSYYDVSQAQKRIWTQELLEKEQVAFHIPGVYAFGAINRDVFETCIATMVQRHEAFRTTFITLEGQPKQRITESGGRAASINYLDLKKQENQTEILTQLIEKERKTPFNLEIGPLLRMKLLQLQEDDWLFLVVMHHIIADGWSVDVMIREVNSLYESYMKNIDSSLPPLRIQYKDYTRWHNDQLSGENLQKHLNYWLNRLQGPLPVLNLPLDYPRPRIKTFAGEYLQFSFTEEVTEQLKRICRQENCTLFMVLTAVVKVLLYRYTGQRDIIIGTIFAGRESRDLENQIGFYVNMLALRNRVMSEQTFAELLHTVRKNILADFEHQAYPFNWLAQELTPVRDLSRNPLFDVVVVFETGRYPLVKSQAESMENNLPDYSESGEGISKFDIRFRFTDMGTQVLNHIQYNPDLFKKQTIMIIKERLQALVSSIITNIDEKIDNLDFLTTYEKEKNLENDKFAGEF